MLALFQHTFLASSGSKHSFQPSAPSALAHTFSPTVLPHHTTNFLSLECSKDQRFSRPSQPPFIGLKAPALEGNQPTFPPTFWFSTPSFPPTRSDSYSAACLSTQMPIQISDSACLCLQNQQAWLLIQASMGWAVPKPIHPPMHSTSSVSSTLPPTSS